MARVLYFEWKDKKEFIIRIGDYEIIRSLSTSRDLEKSMGIIAPITVGDTYNMTSLEGFIQKKLETETLAKSLLTVHVKVN